ncbi:hypothetical protein HMPREF0574_0010 [Mobiluncus curtisii subsp. curtisii ATCC 35241]|uniref:Uncharacterized protein n=1 Tax=Mobiluncus holmesii ATCC 35242 TaxID=887899 RepID=E6M3H3_9ACTO|nr:hypothetical protein HMPREF0574_0010 [Mobiluncus curtisii subsp. curtisii ATCC 35241]EFU82078.1 hypothetical protein HMPREF0576_0447 [Mobiluncus holmesii ATCC 35242]
MPLSKSIALLTASANAIILNYFIFELRYQIRSKALWFMQLNAIRGEA